MEHTKYKEGREYGKGSIKVGKEGSMGKEV
jgi:hypothetical protein